MHCPWKVNNSILDCGSSEFKYSSCLQGLGNSFTNASSMFVEFGEDLQCVDLCKLVAQFCIVELCTKL